MRVSFSYKKYPKNKLATIISWIGGFISSLFLVGAAGCILACVNAVIEKTGDAFMYLFVMLVCMLFALAFMKLFDMIADSLFRSSVRRKQKKTERELRGHYEEFLAKINGSPYSVQTSAERYIAEKRYVDKLLYLASETKQTIKADEMRRKQAQIMSQLQAMGVSVKQ